MAPFNPRKPDMKKTWIFITKWCFKKVVVCLTNWCGRNMFEFFYVHLLKQNCNCHCRLTFPRDLSLNKHKFTVPEEASTQNTAWLYSREEDFKGAFSLYISMWNPHSANDFKYRWDIKRNDCYSAPFSIWLMCSID